MVAKQTEAEKNKLAREAEVKYEEKLSKLQEDPFLGEPDLGAALSSSKISSQSEALARMLNKENIFITGPAGAGKSSVVKRFIDLISAQSRGVINVAVTASTGIAATIIEGQTIHSWAGLGISTLPFNRKKIEKQVWSRLEQMREADVLIIDEVSMIPVWLFDKLNATLKWARRSSKPFGGLQVILLGDFLQLPPVNREPDLDARFIVYSESWKEVSPSYCFLDKIHRAKDKNLIYVLNSIAAGKANDKTRAFLDSRLESVVSVGDNVYTKLYTTNRNVDKENEDMLAKNPNSSKFFYTESSSYEGKSVASDLKRYGVPDFVELKVGATVMLTVNINHDSGFYPNGSIGIVLDMGKKSVTVKFNSGETAIIYNNIVILTEKVKVPLKNGKEEVIEVETGQIIYMPLKLAYAITIHKSQGRSLSGVVADLSNSFTPGLGYVALSRVSSLDDLILKDYDDKALAVDPESMKISRAVRVRSRKNREKFIKDKEHYEGLLTSPIIRQLVWRF